MPKHALVFVHGWVTKPTTGTCPLSKYLHSPHRNTKYLAAPTHVQNLVQPIGVNYATFLVRPAKALEGRMASIKSTLISGVDADDNAKSRSSQSNR